MNESITIDNLSVQQMINIGIISSGEYGLIIT